MKTTPSVLLLVLSMSACVSKTPIEEKIEEKPPVELTAPEQTEVIMPPSIFDEKAFGEKTISCLIEGVYRLDDGVSDASSIAKAITDFCDDLSKEYADLYFEPRGDSYWRAYYEGARHAIEQSAISLILKTRAEKINNQ
jgi:hypothetical protein